MTAVTFVSVTSTLFLSTLPCHYFSAIFLSVRSSPFCTMISRWYRHQCYSQQRHSTKTTIQHQAISPPPIYYPWTWSTNIHCPTIITRMVCNFYKITSFLNLMVTAMASLLIKSIRKIIICLLWSLLVVGVSDSSLFVSSCHGRCSRGRIILGRIILVRLMTARFGWIWGCRRMMLCPMSVSMSISGYVLQWTFSMK